MLTKIVDGKEVVMSAEEEAAIRADWAKSDLAAAIPKKTAAEMLVDQVINDSKALASLKAKLGV